MYLPIKQMRDAYDVFSKHVNPLYTNGFFLLVCYNKLGIVHCTYLGVSGQDFQKNIFILSEDLFMFTNSVDPDEMQHYAAAFHLGLHCLQIYLFRSLLIPEYKVLMPFWPSQILDLAKFLL